MPRARCSRRGSRSTSCRWTRRVRPCSAAKSWRQRSRDARGESPTASRRFTAHGFIEQGADGASGLTLHDPLAVGVAVDPTLVTWERLRLTVGADGETRSATGAPNCRVATRVDRDRFVGMFLERLCPKVA
jgi:inosine-uridine nucleoside N-ribohydrolase